MEIQNKTIIQIINESFNTELWLLRNNETLKTTVTIAPNGINPQRYDSLIIDTEIKSNNGKKQLTYLSLTTKYPQKEEVITAAKIEELADYFGGNVSLRLMLHNNQPSAIDQHFFDITIKEKRKIFNQYEYGQKYFNERKTLEPLLQLLKINYNLQENGLWIGDLQPNMVTTPEKIKETYQLLLNTAYLPSIANGSLTQEFSMRQEPALNNKINIKLNITIDYRNKEHKYIGTDELYLIEKIRKEHPPEITEKHALFKRRYELLTELRKIS